MADPPNPERQRRVNELENKLREIQAEMSKVHTLARLSQLRDELLSVEKEIERLRQS